MINAYLSKLDKTSSSRYLQCGNTSKNVTKIQIYYSFLQIMNVSSLALQLQRQIVKNSACMKALSLALQLQRQLVRYSACKLWVWHCNCSAKLLDIQVFCMQALILALQLQRQIVRYSACKLWVWYCSCSAKLLDSLHACKLWVWHWSCSAHE